MPSLDQLKQTFFDECDEALQQIEAGLTDIRDGAHSDDTINAVFRGVHSVKGGAGIFGFEALVGFAHVFETLLDGIRHGTIKAAPETIDALLSAGDVLSDLVSMSRTGEAIAPGFGNDVRNTLQRFIDGKEGGGAAPAAGEDDNAPAPADFDGLDFKPVQIDFEEIHADAPAAGMRTYAITFRPKAEMLKKANEPLYLIRELRKLGELEINAQTGEMPPLTEMEPDRPYIWWTGTLQSSEPRAKIEEVFEFVVGDCDLEIVDTAPAAAAPIMEIADAPPTAPLEPTAPPPPSAAPAEAAAIPAKSAPASDHPEGGGGRAAAAKPSATTTRIELERIDRVVNMVGELVISQAMLGQIVQDLPEQTNGRLMQVLEEVIHHTRELKDSVMSMRAQPVGSVFQRMPRLVRELSAKTGKKVRLEMAGETTEVDRSIIERLGDPLTHIIRNSVDHGIEAPADRIAAGKNEEGTIRLSAEHRGGRIVIEIADDGAGINSERVLKKAREKGLVAADASLSDDEVNNLIMLPGFSTAEKISDISGRGVGMDVVRSNIQDIGGRISLRSERGRGMTIQLALPLTLAVMDGMVIKCGQQTYVLPLSSIVECLRPQRAEVNNLIGTRGMLQLRGDFVQLVYLGDLLDISTAAGESNESVVIITDAGDGVRFGLVVDELCGHQQVVIKSIEESYGSVPGIAAATILGNGRVAFILDVEKLNDLATVTPVGGGAAIKSASPKFAMN
jgi:two-component system chemotaxis sensor kinase CheA